MRVAIVHDYLNQYGGAERVLEALHDLYPTAPIYTSIYDPTAMPARVPGVGYPDLLDAAAARLAAHFPQILSALPERVRELRSERLRADPEQQQRLRQGRDPAARRAAYLLLPYADALRLAHRRLYRARAGWRALRRDRLVHAADLC